MPLVTPSLRCSRPDKMLDTGGNWVVMIPVQIARLRELIMNLQYRGVTFKLRGRHLGRRALWSLYRFAVWFCQCQLQPRLFPVVGCTIVDVHLWTGAENFQTSFYAQPQRLSNGWKYAGDVEGGQHRMAERRRSTGCEVNATAAASMTCKNSGSR